MNINFNGYKENVLTFEADETVTAPNLPVKITANGTVGACKSGETFCGAAVNLHGGYVAVTLDGYIKLPVTGTVEAGYRKLAADGAGGVMADDGGREYLVLDADDECVGFIL